MAKAPGGVWVIFICATSPDPLGGRDSESDLLGPGPEWGG